MGLGGLAGGQAMAQVGAQAAQLGYAGDDARLFGEGWEWKRHAKYFGRFQLTSAVRGPINQGKNLWLHATTKQREK
jgi:hypothetical protein